MRSSRLDQRDFINESTEKKVLPLLNVMKKCSSQFLLGRIHKIQRTANIANGRDITTVLDDAKNVGHREN